MIIQRSGLSSEETIAISQPAHSWLSGQLARNWGNPHFAGFEPFEDVCYAAELHDIGYLAWEKNAPLNLATGLPQTFYELPTMQRLRVWLTGIEEIRRVSTYAAVLMSRHYCGLSEKYPEQKADDREHMRKFREEQQEFSQKLFQNLAGRRDLREAIGGATLRYHSQLLAVWDLISLHLCMNPSQSFQVPDVPCSKTAACDLELTAQVRDGWQFTVSPWPFRESELRLRYEGSLLRGKFSTDDELLQALDQATLVFIEVELIPAEA